MDPLTVTAILAFVDWKKVLKGAATDAVGKSAKGLLSRLQPDEQEKRAKHR
jgi:hypothetical protein